MPPENVRYTMRISAKHFDNIPETMATFGLDEGISSMREFADVNVSMKDLGVLDEFQDAVAQIDCEPYGVPEGESLEIGSATIYDDGTFEVNLNDPEDVRD